MNTEITKTIDRAERVIAALRVLGECPEAQSFTFSGAALSVDMLQFFPTGHKRDGGWRDIARPFARLLGGVWHVDGDGSWRCDAVKFPGLGGVKAILHYIEPVQLVTKGRPIDLSEAEPTYNIVAVSA
jgi:hypothetical protein